MYVLIMGNKRNIKDKKMTFLKSKEKFRLFTFYLYREQPAINLIPDKETFTKNFVKFGRCCKSCHFKYRPLQKVKFQY